MEALLWCWFSKKPLSFKNWEKLFCCLNTTAIREILPKQLNIHLSKCYLALSIKRLCFKSSHNCLLKRYPSTAGHGFWFIIIFVKISRILSLKRYRFAIFACTLDTIAWDTNFIACVYTNCVRRNTDLARYSQAIVVMLSISYHWHFDLTCSHQLYYRRKWFN